MFVCSCVRVFVFVCSNRRPADYERSYLDFFLAAPGFSWLLRRLSRKNQQINYSVSAFSFAVKTSFCGQALGQNKGVVAGIKIARSLFAERDANSRVSPSDCCQGCPQFRRQYSFQCTIRFFGILYLYHSGGWSDVIDSGQL